MGSEGGHQHDFHALSWNFGKYGRQDVHLHPCERPSCHYELVGLGRECDGDTSTHVPKTLSTRGNSWSSRSNEGKPL